MDITIIFAGAILIIFGLLSTFCVPWIKANTSNKELAQLLQFVRIAVGAAEQLAAVKGYNGEWKKAFVTDFLMDKGFKVNLDTLDLMIEDAVIELHNALKE